MGENRSFSGYGIVFNSDSAPMTIWDKRHGVIDVVERITPGSMEGADISDVIAAYNHNFEKVMGRTSADTLQISRDETGVKYHFEVPDTTYGNDLLTSVKRGDIQGSSFVFEMDWEAGYDVQERDDGKIEATVKKITRVHEIGPVVRPAYPETTAENRSSALFDAVSEFLQRKDEPEQDESDGELERLKLYTDLEEITNKH